MLERRGLPCQGRNRDEEHEKRSPEAPPPRRGTPERDPADAAAPLEHTEDRREEDTGEKPEDREANGKDVGGVGGLTAKPRGNPVGGLVPGASVGGRR